MFIAPVINTTAKANAAHIMYTGMLSFKADTFFDRITLTQVIIQTLGIYTLNKLESELICFITTAKIQNFDGVPMYPTKGYRLFMGKDRYFAKGD